MAQETLSMVVGAQELEALRRKDPAIRVLDVRTPGEFEAMHIYGAYNVPLDTLGEHAEEIRRNVADPVVLVCQSGSRARKAEEALKGAGMPQLHLLEGGVNGWIAAGLPLQTGRKRMSLERQVRIVAGALAAAGGLLAMVASPMFGALAAFVGGGLVFAGVTDTCAMAMVLTKLPYNRPASCDPETMVGALVRGERPSMVGSRPARPPAGASCAG